MTTYAAIPTVYNGVQFRSRLEARWAAFFDLIDWRWQYEPIDLAGYIPDFLVHPPEHRDGACDCEPVGLVCPRLIEVKPALSLTDLVPASEKVDGSGWSGLGFVVGVNPEIALAISAPRGDEFRWQPVDDHDFSPPDFGDRNDAWRAAGNLVQWKRPR